MISRILPPADWSRLDVTGQPLFPGVRPEDVAVAVVEDGDQVVASMTVLRATHFEGVWIDPRNRNAGVGRALLKQATDQAKRWTDDWVFAGAADDRMRDILNRMGGVPLPMESWVLRLGGSECRRP